MCPGVLSGGVRGARWTQIGAIARVDVPWRPLEWRLPCQVICRNRGQRPCTSVRGSSETFLQNIARADMPWSDVWRGSRFPMDTNRCHRASGCALEAGRKAIGVQGELQESMGPGPVRLCVAGRRPSCKPSRERICPGVLSGGVGGARWTQIGAIARADMPGGP